MNPEQAAFLREVNLGVQGYESATTRKVIAAVPEDKSSYTPDSKSMNAKALAWHIASAEAFFLNGILSGKFEMGEGDPGAGPVPRGSRIHHTHLLAPHAGREI